jgi:hypothetical protein
LPARNLAATDLRRSVQRGNRCAEFVRNYVHEAVAARDRFLRLRDRFLRLCQRGLGLLARLRLAFDQPPLAEYQPDDPRVDECIPKKPRDLELHAETAVQREG